MVIGCLHSSSQSNMLELAGREGMGMLVELGKNQLHHLLLACECLTLSEPPTRPLSVKRAIRAIIIMAY